MKRCNFYIFLILIVLSSCSNKTKTFDIGVVLSLSGKGAVYGDRSLNGMQIAVDELNKSSYFKTHNIILIVEDSKSSSSDALLAFNKLISLNKVQVVIGFVLSDEVLACSQTANTNKVVLLTPGAGSIEITNAGPYIYRNRESAFIQADEIAQTCIEMNNKNIGILFSHAANGISYKEAFKKALLSYGSLICSEVGFNEGINDYRPEIKKVFNSNPNGIYLAGLDREIGLILKQAKELGYHSKFYASAGAVSPKLIEIAGEAAEGLITVSEAFDPTDEIIAQSYFVKTYKLKFGKEPEWVSANSYEAIKIIGTLFESGCISSEQIKEGLDSKTFQSFSGELKFDSNGDVIKKSRLLIVKNGNFQKFAINN